LRFRKILYVGNKLNRFGYTATGIEYLGRLLEEAGYRVFYAGEQRNKFLRLIEGLSRIYLLRKKIDYLLIDTYSTLAFYLAYYSAMVARIFAIRYILVLRGGDLPNRLKQSPEKCYKLFRNADHIVAPSRYLFEAFSKAGFNVNLHFIPNPLVLSRYPFISRDEFSPRLLWVRSLHAIYNPAMALHTLYTIRKELGTGELCMVGPDKDGSLQECRSLCDRLGLSDYVQFTGILSKEKWIDLAPQYNFFINTTNFDNAPVSVMEAMALGLPIVSTNVGGIPYLLEDGVDALLVEAGDYEAMAKAIITLVKSSDRAQSLLRSARAKVETFDSEWIKGRWSELLDKLPA
jgi:L-malate glycosyltransferase